MSTLQSMEKEIRIKLNRDLKWTKCRYCETYFETQWSVLRHEDRVHNVSNICAGPRYFKGG